MRYTDADGNEWTIPFTTYHAKRVQRELGINLLTIHRDGDLIERISADAGLLVDIISVLLTDEIQRRGLNEESFARTLRQDALDRATKALVEAITDFFPTERGRALRSSWMKVLEFEQLQSTQTSKILQERGQELNSGLLSRMETVFDQFLEDLRTSPPGKSSTASPDTAASTPHP